MPTLVPGTHTGWNSQKWATTVEKATYQRTVAIPLFDDFGRPLNVMNIPKSARVTGTTLSTTAPGTSLTTSTIIGTPATITPAGNYVAVYWSENLEAQLQYNIDETSAGQMEQGLAETSDQSVLANVATFTQTMSAAGVTGNGWRQAVGRVTGNTNGMALPGEDGDFAIYAIFSHTQYPNFGAIEEFNSAEKRGDSENPYVKGIFMKGGGVLLNFSTVITNDANGWHNFIGTKRAIGIAWNVRTRIKRQDDELENRIICFNHFGSTVVHDLRGLDFRTTASGL